MNINHKTAVIKGNHKVESNMKLTASKLIKFAGLSAMVAGLLFIVIQIIHPVDILSSVTTARWAIIHYLGSAMCLLGLVGITGIYARQLEETGWLGLAGYLLISLFYAITFGFQFVEAFISPLLITEAPNFVESLLALAGGHYVEMNLGALATAYTLNGVLYITGPLLFGIATFRAGVLPRLAAVLFASTGPISAIVVSLVPHPLDRLAAAPLGLGLLWLGYALLSERRVEA